MALITCPECKREGVSGTAAVCPGCGAKITKPLSGLGIVSLILGIPIFIIGAAMGGEPILIGTGVLFMALGLYARRPRSS